MSTEPLDRAASLVAVEALHDDLDQIFLRLGDLRSGHQRGKAALTLTDLERVALDAAIDDVKHARQVLDDGFVAYVSENR